MKEEASLPATRGGRSASSSRGGGGEHGGGGGLAPGDNMLVARTMLTSWVGGHCRCEQRGRNQETRTNARGVVAAAGLGKEICRDWVEVGFVKPLQIACAATSQGVSGSRLPAAPTTQAHIIR
jgi:hypothetical protein